MSLVFNKELNCRHMHCPTPVLKVKEAIQTMTSGEVIKLIADIAISDKCLPAWSARTGHAIIETEQTDSEYIYYIRCK